MRDLERFQREKTTERDSYKPSFSLLSLGVVDLLVALGAQVSEQVARSRWCYIRSVKVSESHYLLISNLIVIIHHPVFLPPNPLP